MIELCFEQEKLVSGGSVYSDILKVAEYVAPRAVAAVPGLGEVVILATAGTLAYDAYKWATNDPAAAQAAQQKQIDDAVKAEIQRQKEAEEKQRQEKAEDEFYERRLKELENRRSEEGEEDYSDFAGGPDVGDFGGNDWGGDWGGGGGGGGHELDMETMDYVC